MATLDRETGLYKPPGPKQPSKYPFVGRNYDTYGEQPGYVYYPYTDSYKIDPKASRGYRYDTGLEEKPPGLGEQLLPVAAGSFAQAGGKYIGENIGSIAKQGAGLLGNGPSGGVSGSTIPTQGAANIPGVAGVGSTIPMTSANGALATTAEANAAYNAPAMAAPGTPFFSLGSEGLLGSGPMPVGNYIPGIAGAYGAYDLLKNKKHGGKGALQGAASGAGIGLTIGGPVGAGIGAVIGGTVGYFGNFGDVDAYRTEWKRKKELYDRGIIGVEQLGPEPLKGRSKEELIEEARRSGGNIEFAKTRDEKSLTPTDIMGYSTILEEAHNRGTDPTSLAQQAIAAGAVREHHGTIDVDWSKVGAQSQVPKTPLPGKVRPKKEQSSGLLSVRN